jgi:hypothetical protein
MVKAANSHPTTPESRKLRFERKFVFPPAEAEDLIESEILTNSYCFREIYCRRRVNNIYFDRPKLLFYYQNVDGDSVRRKFRLRWYEDDPWTIKHPTFEIKKKYGEVGDKETVKLKGIETSLHKLNPYQIQKEIERELKANQQMGFLFQLQDLVPKLINTYQRRYFLSFCENFRITIDYDMQFYDPELPNFRDRGKSIDNVVIELKYDREHDEQSRQLAQEIGSRLSKNSKYVQGIDLFC